MSDLLKLNWRDLLKGLVTAILSGVIAYLYDAVSTGNLQLTTEALQKVGFVALLAGLGYLSKNLLTASDGKILGSL
jgi:hypothetical protein